MGGDGLERKTVGRLGGNVPGLAVPDKRQDDERPATHTARPGHPRMCAMHRISSLRRADGAGQGGKQKLSRTGDGLGAASRLMLL